MTATDSTAEDPRWVVELTSGETHDVGAYDLSVDGGALVFYDSEDRVLVAYAPASWVGVNR